MLDKQILEEDILQKMENTYNNLIQIYGKDRILGVFSLGSINYGFCNSLDEINFVGVYIPTFDDLCISTPKITNLDINVMIVDIRKMYYANTDPSPLGLEMLCSKYMLLNEKYSNIFHKFFINNKESIGHINDAARIIKCKKRIQKAYAQNNFFEVYCLFLCCMRFIKGCNIDECFRTTNEKELKELNYVFLHNDLMPVDIFEIIDTLDTHIRFYLENSGVNDIGVKMLKQGVIELITLALNNSADDDTILDSFLKSLTESQKDCFYYIVNSMNGDSDIVSMMQLENNSNFSKTIIRTVLNKMEKYGIADIHSRGRKGTEIILKILL